MIKKLVCVSVMATALVAAAPAAQAAPAPDPTQEVPATALLSGVLGALEVGHPVTSLNTILPNGLTGH
ncbi:hypothetical protein ACIP2X_26355 [Streptomyces sp. NPDC089424]|uniref:hypothetical protein n=1 Tax=Streptomyces sp. NPDC089424 TaxID=3365917 RepID=UPI0037F34207